MDKKNVQRISIANAEQNQTANPLLIHNNQSNEGSLRQQSMSWTKREELPTFTTDMIPECFKSWIMDIADRTKINPAIVMVPALISFSNLMRKKIGILPKRNDKWFVMPNLWGVVVTQSNNAMSQAIKEALMPSENLDKQVRFRSVRNGKDGKYLFVKTRKLKARREDLFIKQELIEWLESLTRSHHSSRQELISKCWHNYRNLGANFQNRSFSVFGTTEPQILEKYLKAAKQDSYKECLIQRLQLLLFNDEIIDAPHNIDQRVNVLARESVLHIFDKINCAANSNSEICGVRFAKDAQEISDDWMMELEYKTRFVECEHSAYFGHLKKYRSLMPSLALIFWVLEGLNNIHGWGSVSSSAVLLAIKWCRYLEKHALRTYSGSKEYVSTGLVRRLKNIQQQNNNEVGMFESAYNLLNGMSLN